MTPYRTKKGHYTWHFAATAPTTLNPILTSATRSQLTALCARNVNQEKASVTVARHSKLEIVLSSGINALLDSSAVRAGSHPKKIDEITLQLLSDLSSILILVVLTVLTAFP
jgi:hypothetical protein